ncbi:uncharacterized protein LOC102290889 [Haplochromis burtoni]|uniref:uncharacterized protein LOC102290889 n=1 Tax=Haplochromis burtoni TaxID=8153 RepID=UPI0003BCCEC9|nr:uncharacterized protein LOC102290889 [Haplochromis burtoni]
MEQQLSSDSNSSIIIEHTSADSDVDTSVPELRRTDSVILTRQMLGCPSISSTDISEEEYGPQTAEESDSSAESLIQHKRKKTKARKITSGNSQEDVRQLKRRCTRTQCNSSNSNAKESSSLDAEDTNTSASSAASSAGSLSSASLLSTKSSGASQTTRRKWTEAEIKAVEKTLMEYISSGKVPGKAECLKCIETSPLALKERRWEGVKFYVKNRIDALKRQSVKRR